MVAKRLLEVFVLTEELSHSINSFRFLLGNFSVSFKGTVSGEITDVFLMCEAIDHFLGKGTTFRCCGDNMGFKEDNQFTNITFFLSGTKKIPDNWN